MRFFQNAPRLAAKLQRALGSRAEGFGYVEPNLRSVLLAEDFTDHQYQWLRRVRTWSAGRDTPTNAARYSAAMLRALAPGSLTNQVVRVRRLIISTQPGSLLWFEYSWGLFGPGLAPAIFDLTTQQGSPRDSRFAGQQSLCEVVFCTSAVSKFQNNSLVLHDDRRVIDIDYTFVNNTAGFMVVMGTTNTPFNVTIEWDERLAAPEELS